MSDHREHSCFHCGSLICNEKCKDKPPEHPSAIANESLAECWRAEASIRRLKSAIGALKNVEEDIEIQSVIGILEDKLKDLVEVLKQRRNRYQWLTSKKFNANQ